LWYNLPIKKSIFPIIAILAFLVLGIYYVFQYQKSTTPVVTPVVKAPIVANSAPAPVVVAPNLLTDKVIDLNGTSLVSVPADLLNNTAVVDLNLSNNLITTLPSQIQAWVNLEAFRIGNNKLTALPAEIRFFTKLAVLDASNNDITGVPAEIGQLTNLKEIDLSDNGITEFPNEILKLTGLETLDIRGNPVTAAHLKLLQDNLTDTEILFE